jgi:gas vesicle protein
MMSRHDEGASVLLAFLAGAVTGASVALLFAPAAGDETRQYLSAKARESRDRASAAARDGRDRASTAARQGRDALNRQKDHLASAIEKGREAYQKARQGEEPAGPGGGA